MRRGLRSARGNEASPDSSAAEGSPLPSQDPPLPPAAPPLPTHGRRGAVSALQALRAALAETEEQWVPGLMGVKPSMAPRGCL